MLLPARDDEPHGTELNPLELICTCKGFRLQGLCSHCIAVTVYTETAYNEAYLDNLIQKLSETKRASHRPLNARNGTRIQPAGDSSEDDEPICQPVDWDDDLDNY